MVAPSCSAAVIYSMLYGFRSRGLHFVNPQSMSAFDNMSCIRHNSMLSSVACFVGPEQGPPFSPGP